MGMIPESFSQYYLHFRAFSKLSLAPKPKAGGNKKSQVLTKTLAIKDFDRESTYDIQVDIVTHTPQLDLSVPQNTDVLRSFNDKRNSHIIYI